MQLHIIYTETEMLLSKRTYASWREIQNAYESYKSSLGPWPTNDVIEYLTDEYSNFLPSAQAQVAALLAGQEEVKVLTFRAQQPAA